MMHEKGGKGEDKDRRRRKCMKAELLWKKNIIQNFKHKTDVQYARLKISCEFSLDQ